MLKITTYIMALFAVVGVLVLVVNYHTESMHYFGQNASSVDFANLENTTKSLSAQMQSQTTSFQMSSADPFAYLTGAFTFGINFVFGLLGLLTQSFHILLNLFFTPFSIFGLQSIQWVFEGIFTIAIFATLAYIILNKAI